MVVLQLPKLPRRTIEGMVQGLIKVTQFCVNSTDLQSQNGTFETPHICSPECFTKDWRDPSYRLNK